jgi:hypothetical protein
LNAGQVSRIAVQDTAQGRLKQRNNKR